MIATFNPESHDQNGKQHRQPTVEMNRPINTPMNPPIAKISEREQHNRQIVQALPAAVYTCDMQGRITFYNEAAVALWGREPELGKDLWCGSWRIYETDGRLIPLEDCPMAWMIREGKPASGREVVIERPDGERFHVMPHPQLIRDDAGAVVGAVNMLVNITERKTVEDQLRDSKELLDGVMGNSHDCIKLLDLEGRLLWMNSFGLRAMQIENFQTLQNAMWLDFWKGEDHTAACAAVAVAKANGVGSFAGFCPTTKGVAKWWEVVITPILNAAGQPEKLLGISRDITERRKAEEAVRNSNTFYTSLVESLPQNIFRKDVDGRFTFANRRFCLTLGRPFSEVLGRTDADFFAPELATRYRADDLRVMETGQPLETEEQHRDGQGNILHVQVNKTPLLDAAGRAIGVQGVFADITAHKRALEVLEKRAAELERFNRLSVGRELQMIELKKEVNELAKLAGRNSPYDLSFLENQTVKTGAGYG